MGISTDNLLVQKWGMTPNVVLKSMIEGLTISKECQEKFSGKTHNTLSYKLLNIGIFNKVKIFAEEIQEELIIRNWEILPSIVYQFSMYINNLIAKYEDSLEGIKINSIMKKSFE